MLDNPSLYEEELVQYTPKLIEGFRKYSFALVIAEREFRYENIDRKTEIENNFSLIYDIEYTAQDLKEKIFDRLFSFFQTIYSVPANMKDDLRQIYIQDKRKSLSESTFAAIEEIIKQADIKYIFDWVDWERFSNEREPQLKELYLLIATFYQFGFSLPIEFCLKFLENVNSRTIINVIGSSYNLPIYIRKNHLFLRHETIASWYLNESVKNRKMSLTDL